MASQVSANAVRSVHSGHYFYFCCSAPASPDRVLELPPFCYTSESTPLPIVSYSKNLLYPQPALRGDYERREKIFSSPVAIQGFNCLACILCEHFNDPRKPLERVLRLPICQFQLVRDVTITGLVPRDGLLG